MLKGGLDRVDFKAVVRQPSQKRVMMDRYARRTVGSWGVTASEAARLFRRMARRQPYGVVRTQAGFVAFA